MVLGLQGVYAPLAGWAFTCVRRISWRTSCMWRWGCPPTSLLCEPKHNSASQGLPVPCRLGMVFYNVVVITAISCTLVCFLFVYC